MAATEPELLARLVADGLLRREANRPRTTRRWQGAMARSAFRLMYGGAADEDLRLPVACALVELYGHLSDEELTRMIEIMTPIEAAELDPRVHLEEAGFVRVE